MTPTPLDLESPEQRRDRVARRVEQLAARIRRPGPAASSSSTSTQSSSTELDRQAVRDARPCAVCGETESTNWPNRIHVSSGWQYTCDTCTTEFVDGVPGGSRQLARIRDNVCEVLAGLHKPRLDCAKEVGLALYAERGGVTGRFEYLAGDVARLRTFAREHWDEALTQAEKFAEVYRRNAESRRPKRHEPLLDAIRE